MFEKKIYALINQVGLAKEPFSQGLADYIMKTGGSIRPMIVDAFGNIMSVKFGDGTCSVEHIPAEFIKYFAEIDPMDLCAIVVPTKPLPPLKAEVIQFKLPEKYTIEPKVSGLYDGACAA